MATTEGVRSMGLVLVGALLGAGAYSFAPSSELVSQVPETSPAQAIEIAEVGGAIEERSGLIGTARVTATIARAKIGVSPRKSVATNVRARGALPSVSTETQVVAPIAPRITEQPTQTPAKIEVKPRFSASPVPTPIPTQTPRPTPARQTSGAGSVSATPMPIATPTPIASTTPTPAPTLEATPEFTPTPEPIPEPTAQPAPAGGVVISEIAWAGTDASSSDEWIELYNTGATAQDLSGWTITALDGKPTLSLSGAISPQAYFLIERTSDDTVSDIVADLVIPFSGGSLENAGETLELRDATGAVIDSIACDTGWFAGSASPDYATMERIDVAGGSHEAGNWASNTGLVTTGLDAGQKALVGTPKYKNSVSP